MQAAALKGEAPPGLPLKGSGQASSDAQPKVSDIKLVNIFYLWQACNWWEILFYLKQDVDGATPKASDALSGELWQTKKDRIRQASVYGKQPGWDLCSVSCAFNYLTKLRICYQYMFFLALVFYI